MSGDWKSFDVDISSTNWVDVFGVRPCTVRALDLADDMMTMLSSYGEYDDMLCIYIYLSIYLCLSFINDNKYSFYIYFFSVIYDVRV